MRWVLLALVGTAILAGPGTAAAIAADPVIYAAGDIACAPGDPADLHQVPRDADLGHHRERRRREGARARRPPVQQRLALEPARLLRPQLGARQVDHAPRARQPREHRQRLLRLLQRLRRQQRPGRRARQGLLQLRRRQLAPDRAELELLARRPATPARRRSSGCAPTSPPTRAPARSPTGTTRASAPATTATAPSCRTSGRRSTTRTRTSCSSATATTTSASRPERERRPRPHAGHARVRRRHRRRVLHRASAAPSRTARCARTTPSAC